MADDSPTPSDLLKFERDEDFASLYANHIYYETTVWDLKLIFGQLDLNRGPNLVTQHTAIALSWLQVKIMSYFLQVNLAIYEAAHGTIKIPPAVIPPEPPLPTENDSAARLTTEKIQEIRRRLLEDKQ